jgi:hypothetical protein
MSQEQPVKFVLELQTFTTLAEDWCNCVIVYQQFFLIDKSCLVIVFLPGGQSTEEKSSQFPSQFIPPLNGAGLEQVRVRLLAQWDGLTS